MFAPMFSKMEPYCVMVVVSTGNFSILLFGLLPRSQKAAGSILIFAFMRLPVAMMGGFVASKSVWYAEVWKASANCCWAKVHMTDEHPSGNSGSGSRIRKWIGTSFLGSSFLTILSMA